MPERKPAEFEPDEELGRVGGLLVAALTKTMTEEFVVENDYFWELMEEAAKRPADVCALMYGTLVGALINAVQHGEDISEILQSLGQSIALMAGGVNPAPDAIFKNDDGTYSLIIEVPDDE